MAGSISVRNYVVSNKRDYYPYTHNILSTNFYEKSLDINLDTKYFPNVVSIYFLDSYTAG